MPFLGNLLNQAITHYGEYVPKEYGISPSGIGAYVQNLVPYKKGGKVKMYQPNDFKAVINKSMGGVVLSKKRNNKKK